MDVLVTGSSGLIGSALVPALARAGHRPVRLARGGETRPDTVRWDPAEGSIDAAAIEGMGAVVHLAGVGIAERRWSEAHKQAILESRVRGTRLLVDTLAALSNAPQVLVSASAVGYYGDRGDEVLDESSAPGSGFLSDVCVRWEQEAMRAAEAGIRVATIRTGIVLSPEGGALAKLLPLFRLGVGGPFGSGRQYQSWISMDDEVGAILHLLTSDVAGPVNLTAPAPVTNAELAATLGRVLHRPARLRVPRFGPALVLGGELADNLLFEGQRVLPRVLEADGYPFVHRDLEGCLRALLGRPAEAS